MILDRMVSLRSWVGLLAVGAALIAFCTVGGALLLYRMPQLEAALQSDMQQRSASVGRLLDHYTESVERQLMAVAALPGERTAREMQAYLESVVGDGRLFEVGFLLDHAGRVQGIGLPERHRQAATILRGIDFAFNPLFHEAIAAQIRSGEKPVAVWSDRYLSVLSGKNTVGVAVATPRYIVVGEVSLERILEMLVDSSAAGDSVVTIADRRGLWLASSSPDAPGRHFNFSKLPLFVELLRAGDAVPRKTEFLGEPRIVGGVVSKRLRWVILASAPSGLDDAQTRVTVETIVAGALGALFLCILLSPMAALYVSSRIGPLIALTQRVAKGDEPTDWPSGGADSGAGTAVGGPAAHGCRSAQARTGAARERAEARNHFSGIPDGHAGCQPGQRGQGACGQCGLGAPVPAREQRRCRLRCQRTRAVGGSCGQGPFCRSLKGREEC